MLEKAIPLPYFPLPVTPVNAHAAENKNSSRAHPRPYLSSPLPRLCGIASYILLFDFTLTQPLQLLRHDSTRNMDIPNEELFSRILEATVAVSPVKLLERLGAGACRAEVEIRIRTTTTAVVSLKAGSGKLTMVVSLPCYWCWCQWW